MFQIKVINIQNILTNINKANMFTLYFFKNVHKFGSFKNLTNTLMRIEETSSIINKKKLLVEHYKTLTPQNQSNLSSLLKFIHQKPKTGLAQKLIMNHLAEAYGLQRKGISIKKICDQIINQDSYEKKIRNFQISQVLQILERLTQIIGQNSQKIKLDIIKDAVQGMSCEQIQIFIKILVKNLRIGMKQKTMKFNEGTEQTQTRELMLCKPLKTLADVEDFCEKKNSNILADLKYDGERTLIVYTKGGQIQLISRNRKSQNHNYKPLVKKLYSQLPHLDGIQSITLDGQIVHVNSEGQPLPLQYLISSRGKEDDQIAENQRVFVFDILALNGKSLLQTPLQERRNLFPQTQTLRPSTIKEFSYPKQRQDLINYFLQILKNKHQGLILKGINDHYYLNGTRKHWGKWKKGCKITDSETGEIDLDLIVMGVDYGQGKKKDKLSTFLLGVYDQGQIHPISRVGTGFSDELLQQLTKNLTPLLKTSPPPNYKLPKSIKMSYFLDPELIFEVTCQDLTRSPLYSYAFRQNYGGISLRFPVFQRIRADKPVEDCSADVILQLSKGI